MRRERSWAGRTGRYGAAGEGGVWRVAYGHYYWDRMQEAYEAATELGAGHWGHGLVGYRQIEGEWITRERGEITRVNDWLQIETIADEMPEPFATFAERVTDACDRVARRFGFQHGPPVLLSVLSEESNVPWMPGRHGYCVDKHPYEKICVPAYSLRDHDDLEHVVQHEYAHVIALNLSQGRCPHWLDEAVAMVAGGGVDKRAWRLLESGRAEWRDAQALDMAYLGDREDAAGREDVWMAYQQSAVIGFYLASLEGERGLSSLLRAHSNKSVLQDLLLRVRGRSETDEALREVYGFGTRVLFTRAEDWLKMAQG